MSIIARGTVSRGFESVREMFEAMLRFGCDTRAQLCVYCDDERVVDLWGTAPNVVDDSFGPDSVVNVYSSSKTITAIVVAKMVDKGLLNYDAMVIDYWPEFGTNGKGELTVADILRHEGGLSKFDTSLRIEDLTRESIKENAVGAVIEKQRLVYREGDALQRREYHSMTRGWILNEIVRRVDPQGRTVGEILRSDVCEPLGGVDAFIGLTPTEFPRVAPVENASGGYLIKQSLTPSAFGREIDMNFFEMVGLIKYFSGLAKKATRRDHPIELQGIKLSNFGSTFNTENARIAEMPSANGHASARGMAALASAMVNDGVFQKKRLLSSSTVGSFHSEPTEGDMLFQVNTFVKGGVCLDRPPTVASSAPMPRNVKVEGLEGCYGWFGYGGSVIQWHPETKIGFAFVPTFLYGLDVTNVRGRKLLAEAIRCAKLRNPSASR